MLRASRLLSVKRLFVFVLQDVPKKTSFTIILASYWLSKTQCGIIANRRPILQTPGRHVAYILQMSTILQAVPFCKSAYTWLAQCHTELQGTTYKNYGEPAQ